MSANFVMSATSIDGMSPEGLLRAIENTFQERLAAGSYPDSRGGRTQFYYDVLTTVDPEGYTDPWIGKQTVDSLEILCEEHGEEAAARLIRDAAIRALGRGKE